MKTGIKKGSDLLIRITGIVLCICLIHACSSKKVADSARANISLPAYPVEYETEKTGIKKLPDVIEMKDRLGNKTIYAKAEHGKDGQSRISVELGEVTVTAKMKSIPERFGKVNIDFVVTVPGQLIDKDWQLNLMPLLIKNGNHIPFGELVISGAEFDRLRQRDYHRYQKYLDKIVPDSLYDNRFLNSKAYLNYITKYDRDERNRVLKDSMDYVKYHSYIGKLQSRYSFFNARLNSNKQWLQNRFRLEKIVERFDLFDRDTIYIARAYAKRHETIREFIPMFHLTRNISYKTMRGKYRDSKYRMAFENDYMPVTAGDSAFLKNRFLDRKKIEKNEELIANKEAVFTKTVRFPRNLNARLDTVIYTNGNFEYYYKQGLDTDEDTKRMQLYMNSFLLTKKGEEYILAVSDTLSYSVSSMIQFLDRTPRYLRTIVERKATSTLRANITFKSGRAELDLNLDNNSSEVDSVRSMVSSLATSEEFVLDSVSLVSGCSPEGSYLSNMQLSKKRSESIRKYFLSQFPDMEESGVKAKAKGEDWDALATLISQSMLDNRNEILDIIGKNTNPDACETELKRKFPKDYEILRKEYYPKLRAVDFIFHVHRRGMIKDTIHTTKPDLRYAEGITLLDKRKYKDALVILTEYNDWNTAICLMSLGYDRAAYNILTNEKESSDREYLLAVLASRLGREEEAVRRYLHSCELDNTKRWRGTLDPEINKLIKAYSLHGEDDE
jgi:outer membrane protein OmpA-like peptidoglycan-associated protein